MTSLMEITKPLNIGYERTCQCKPNHINCGTAKEWMKSQVAVWEFYYTKRDIRDKNIHPAVFPIALPAKCIEMFTHRGELVLDPFAGIGTTLLAAIDLDRTTPMDALNELKEIQDKIKRRECQGSTYVHQNSMYHALCAYV